MGLGKDHVLGHNVADHGIFLRHQQVTDGDHTDEQTVPLGNVASIDRLFVISIPTDALKGFRHGHVLIKAHVLRGHHTACAVLGVTENAVDGLAGLLVGVPQNSLDHPRGHLLDQLYRIVDIKLRKHLLQVSVTEGVDQRFLLLRFHLYKDLRGGILGKDTEQQKHFLFFKLPEKVGNIGGFEQRECTP